MPPCARSAACKDPVSFASMLEKVRAGLDTLLAHLPRFRQEHYDKCQALATMVATPLDVPIPFSWTLEDITELIEYRAADDNVVEENPPPMAEAPWPHNLNEFVLLRPSDNEPKPFYIAKIVAKETLPDGRMGVRLMYYEHDANHPKDKDPFTGVYDPSSSHWGKPTSALPLMSVHDSSIQDKITMRKPKAGYGGGYQLQITENGLRKVKYWVGMFNAGNDYDVEEDD